MHANRIGCASFSIDGNTYSLEKNDGDNTNHGGFAGLNKKVWAWEPVTNGIHAKRIYTDSDIANSGPGYGMNFMHTGLSTFISLCISVNNPVSASLS